MINDAKNNNKSKLVEELDKEDKNKIEEESDYPIEDLQIDIGPETALYLQ